MAIELSEEILYSVSKELVAPLDEGLWSSVAVQLTNRLCNDIIFSPSNMASCLLQSAKHFANVIKEACRSSTPCNSPSLQFGSGINDDAIVNDFFREQFHGLNRVDCVSELNSNVPRGLVHVLNEIKANNEVYKDGCLKEKFVTNKLNQSIKADITYVVTSHNRPSSMKNESSKIQRRQDAVQCGLNIDKRWYLLWQVVYVTHVMSSVKLLHSSSMENPIEIRSCNRSAKDTISTTSSAIQHSPTSAELNSQCSQKEENVFLYHHKDKKLKQNGDKIQEKVPTQFKSHYSLEKLCDEVGVNINDARNALDQGILTHYKVPSFSPRRKPKNSESKRSKKKSGKKKTKTQTPQNSMKGKFATSLFNKIILETLIKRMNWSVVYGNRPTDRYFLPPGVERGKGFKPRVDFFDAGLQVYNFLKTDSRWKDKKDIVEALSLFSDCKTLVDKLKAQRKMPKGELKIDWLKSQLKQK